MESARKSGVGLKKKAKVLKRRQKLSKAYVSPHHDSRKERFRSRRGRQSRRRDSMTQEERTGKKKKKEKGKEYKKASLIVQGKESRRGKLM